jgi:GH24 family phage-related lysozyme (muramidase)
MSGSSSVLREYLVKLGWKIDQQGYRNFQEAMTKTAKTAVEMGKAFVKVGESVAIGTSALGLALHSIAKGMEGIYYSSQRTGASAKELGALEYGFQRVGLSAEDARGSVEALAAARRTNPGLNGVLAGFGINPGEKDNAKVFIELLGKLRGIEPYMRGKYAGMFGLNESVVNQAELNGPELDAGIKHRMEMYRKEGYDPDAAAKKARDFINIWNDAKQHFVDISQEIAVKMLPVADRVLTFLEKVADLFAKADKATGGWSTGIVALVAALAPLITALKLTGAAGAALKVFGLLRGGIGAAGAVAEGVGAGATVAGGGGLLAMITPMLPIIVAAAVIAGLVWMTAHPEAVRKAAAATWEWTKSQAQEIHGIGGQMGNFAQGVKAAGGWVKLLSLQGGPLGDLARMTAGFEGFSAKVYKDIAGNATAFFGHKLKPGEDVSGQNPIGLLMSDLTGALKSVHSLVKTHLSHNQENALADFAYNVGAAKFAQSTLLRKLNAGDTAGAADQFQHWNHALVNGHMQTVKALTDRRAAEAQLFRAADRPVTIEQKTDYHISSTDPRGAAGEVERRQARINADLVRNLAGAVQ